MVVHVDTFPEPDAAVVIIPHPLDGTPAPDDQP
jgi:hypothetical protein